jgi:hypothetical protein
MYGFYEWLDMAVKIITVAVAILLAFEALAAYRKEVDEKVLEERIKAFDEAIKTAGEVTVARDWKTFGDKLDDFGAINHGQVLASLGEGEAHHAIDSFYNAAGEIWNTDVTKLPSPPFGALDDALEKMARQFNDVTTLPNRKKGLREP